MSWDTCVPVRNVRQTAQTADVQYNDLPPGVTVMKWEKFVSPGKSGCQEKGSRFCSYTAIPTSSGDYLESFYPGYLYSHSSMGKISPGSGNYLITLRPFSLSSLCCPRDTNCPRFISTAPGGSYKRKKKWDKHFFRVFFEVVTVEVVHLNQPLEGKLRKIHFLT